MEINVDLSNIFIQTFKFIILCIFVAVDLIKCDYLFYLILCFILIALFERIFFAVTYLIHKKFFYRKGSLVSVILYYSNIVSSSLCLFMCVKLFSFISVENHLTYYLIGVIYFVISDKFITLITKTNND